MDPLQAESSASRLRLNAEVVEGFAQSMAGHLIQSFLKLEPKVAASGENLEMLAEELASAVMEIALREACIPGSVEGSEEAKNLSFVDKPGDDEDMADTEIEEIKEIPTYRDAQCYHPPLSQSGLLVVGSLDYPDAPPTTPLIPELERSRHSFARKLKGGLAKVFLPSPPPPTPKDKEDRSDCAVSDPQAELMEHLMHSLSSNELGRDGSEAGSLQGADAEALAEGLSSDIINWVFNVNKMAGTQVTDESDLHLLAHQLADTIIASSLDKAKMPV